MTKDKTRRAKSIPPVAGDWVANFPEDPAHYAVMIGDVRVRIRRADRVFDGGAVCRAYGTRWADYRASVQGQAAIAATARRFGIPRHRVLTTSSPAQAPAGPFTVPYTAVVETRPAAAAGTGRGGAREIWVHPDLVVGLVTWHDPGAGGLVVFWFEQLWGYRESGAAVWPPVPSSLPHRFGVADLTPRATDELLTAGPFDHADGMDRTHAALARLQAAKQAARQAWTEPTTGVSGGAQTARDVPAHPPDALARLQAARLSMAKPTTGSGGTTQTGRASTDGCQTAGPATSAGALFHTVAEYAKAHSCSLSSENVSRVEAHLEAECRRKGVTTAHYPDPVRGRIPLFPVSVLRPLFENYRLFA